MAAPLPTGTRWVAALPDGGTTQAGLPTGTRAHLPDRFYIPPPLAAAVAEGTLTVVAIPAALAGFSATGGLTAVQVPAPGAPFAGTGTFRIPTDRLTAEAGAVGALAAAAAPVTTAQFSAAGLLSAIQAAAPTAQFTGEGTLLIPTNQGVAPFAGTGDLSAAAVPTALAQFSATGLLTGIQKPAAGAPFTAAGSLTGAVVARTTAPFSATGTLAAAAQTFMPSGMTKNGTATTSTTYTVVPSWTADTTGYPGSTVSGNALVVNGSKTGATITVQLTWTAGAGGNDIRVRIMKNGVQVGAESGSDTTSPTNHSVTTDVVTGDLITVERKGFGTWDGTYAATIQAGATTYVRVT
ncbi:hypothetical protein [Nocardia thailandica]|uniref:hypothetical protein n=1 Tax=Nocardia thailandica TaxID=257275 RepID=UPI0002D9A4EE|nr:hypothetical protein [Nocardia thailandica]